MNLPEAARFAWQGVTVNKSRSALTMLGVLIGVASVIVLVAVGTGASRSVQDTLSTLGTNTLTVTVDGEGGAALGTDAGPPLPGLSPEPRGGSAEEEADGAQSPGEGGRGTRTRPAELTAEDAAALTDSPSAPDVLAVAPVVSPPAVDATFRGVSHPVGTTTGSTSAYLTINNDRVAQGRSFSDSDHAAHSRVVLVGATVAEELGGGPEGSALLERTIELNGMAFRVIGVLAAKGTFGPQDTDDRVVAPATAVQDTLAGYRSLSSIVVQATSAETVTAAQAQVEAILDERHGTDANTRDFTVTGSAATLEAASSITAIFTLLLGAIAAISLVVGGIGVMNIMLVTVTERTREIGIRKAIGAGRGDIIAQFLLEAVMLSMFGGLAGIAIGLLSGLIDVGGFSPVVAPYSVVLGFGFAVATGLFFGWYPARRAASLRPIDALRYE